MPARKLSAQDVIRRCARAAKAMRDVQGHLLELDPTVRAALVRSPAFVTRLDRASAGLVDARRELDRKRGD